MAEQPEAQIVLMTGHASAVGALDAVSSGAYDYLPKPFENERVIRAAIDRNHAKHDASLAGAREVAFFPPMTGG